MHALWCLSCKRVSDGVLGKLLYLCVSLGALAYLSSPSTHTQDLLNLSLAALAGRHWFMKTYWGRILRLIPLKK